jgi:hypothetical protein
MIIYLLKLEDIFKVFRNEKFPMVNHIIIFYINLNEVGLIKIWNIIQEVKMWHIMMLKMEFIFKENSFFFKNEIFI